ncbi:hypothetical protein PIB30_042775 [Stylosanthes scabra]|uniref:Uncharacterized protein n=1 Tax=Stylosanthes scabra TaxID=79078 RepID=A0ABU6YCQ1_9FABA|nr:hypothetical protein [Stylosanthes scabra]
MKGWKRRRGTGLEQTRASWLVLELELARADIQSTGDVAEHRRRRGTEAMQQTRQMAERRRRVQLENTDIDWKGEWQTTKDKVRHPTLAFWGIFFLEEKLADFRFGPTERFLAGSSIQLRFLIKWFYY